MICGIKLCTKKYVYVCLFFPLIGWSVVLVCFYFSSGCMCSQSGNRLSMLQYRVWALSSEAPPTCCSNLLFASNSQSELGHGQFMLAVVITISEGPCVSRYVSVWHSWVGETRLVTSDLVFTTNDTLMQELRYGEEDASAAWKDQAFWKNTALKEGFFFLDFFLVMTE